jgi:YVTN family beta-propeller protein
VTTVNVGVSPRALGYNPLTNRLFCANSLSNSVAAIDGATDVVTGTVAVGATPLAFAFNPVQNRVYVANHAGSSISVLRDSATAVAESPAGEHTVVSAASVVRGVLRVEDSRRNPGHRAALMDINGREVVALQAGANDVSRLAPGVYFCRQVREVRRVLIAE